MTILSGRGGQYNISLSRNNAVVGRAITLPCDMGQLRSLIARKEWAHIAKMQNRDIEDVIVQYDVSRPNAVVATKEQIMEIVLPFLASYDVTIEDIFSITANNKSTTRGTYLSGVIDRAIVLIHKTYCVRMNAYTVAECLNSTNEGISMRIKRLLMGV